MRWEALILIGFGGRGDMTYRWFDLVLLLAALASSGLIVWCLEATRDA